MDYIEAPSALVLHESTCLSLSLSAGSEQIAGEDDPCNLYGKLGSDAEWSSHGATGFCIDRTSSGNRTDADDPGRSVGAAVVQSFDAIGLERRGQVRHFSVDRPSSSDFNDAAVGALGARLKF